MDAFALGAFYGTSRDMRREEGRFVLGKLFEEDLEDQLLSSTRGEGGDEFLSAAIDGDAFDSFFGDG